MACGRVGKAWERSWAAVAVVVLVGVVVLAGSVDSFNRDRPIIKWSPLWLNNYRPRGVLFKRFRDEPIDKWTPGYFSSSPEHYYDQKKDAGGCGRENSLCRFVSVRSGEPREVRCCGALQCVFTGVSFTCADPSSMDLETTENEIY
ncbi:uncharacterized protein LOC126985889 isoform X1 [Eriocheir sinensis]|uniref:uncharacterized protein LOC126985889 isoform X1 n=1 Tax=Eriocheir sinensis TaxID=95602 RepID=UPI0021C61769|nr:uncharacterized protein LOC126985889 isoform X1 [Eriocheir sinensis]XP_050697363.1 uncharacterized protein LOC126985889 isoform X1 [Eriocheir sinensis]XP_050697364.1 uncharacterized protein LOC126985889 isoform X1 [Eriocheir sinensis]